jgi:hypothetical protein
LKNGELGYRGFLVSIFKITSLMSSMLITVPHPKITVFGLKNIE